jgi:hypothetical protein
MDGLIWVCIHTIGSGRIICFVHPLSVEGGVKNGKKTGL